MVELEYAIIAFPAPETVPLTATGEEVGDALGPVCSVATAELAKLPPDWVPISHSLSIVSGHPVLSFLIQKPK